MEKNLLDYKDEFSGIKVEITPNKIQTANSQVCSRKSPTLKYIMMTVKKRLIQIYIL